MVYVRIVRHFGTNDFKFVTEHDTSVFINDELVLRGDQYHNKMDEYCEGVIDTIEKLKNQGIIEEYDLTEINLNDCPDWD